MKTKISSYLSRLFDSCRLAADVFHSRRFLANYCLAPRHQRSGYKSLRPLSSNGDLEVLENRLLLFVPTLDVIGNVTSIEDAAEETVNLSGLPRAAVNLNLCV